MPVRQGDIYWADLNPTQGREQRGKRPVLIISRNEINQLPLTVLVMAGSGAEHFDPSERFPTDLWVSASESGLPKDTVFLGLQIRSLDRSRLSGPIGKISSGRIQEVWTILNYVADQDITGSESV